MNSQHTTHIVLSDEVAAAAANQEAIVALESTIITHGMPAPDNVETARRVEAAVRANGATPATIAVVDGVARIGLTDEELDRLGQPGPELVKIGNQNLAASLYLGQTGGTTVAVTMKLAALAGIKIFATGGIGGVHRGAQNSFDISGDLEELARTPVAVVSAGFKSILDIAKTTEYLETLGVPIVGYQTATLPSFYSIDSPHGVNLQLDSPKAVGGYLHTHWSLDPARGAVIANPIPQHAAIPTDRIEAAIAQACVHADAEGISGKELTPFLLQWLVDATDGESLEANKELVVNNAKVAALIAQHLTSPWESQNKRGGANNPHA
ncbi:MAG: pseudouridine-5'-phosphate glycosidase [Acidimicrobiia bacterium]|nr:pseudouridine-5'-phosphate glycosidase [Acidimicrobiia bacterium]MYB10264.1 pseudouridine-5'-phosphate glycosidase [Acidimicrobiia bacterium]MYG60027.1 pseudouridine-5'-phosphate glycosidase [Acidimicrobiia bacterium]MYJ32195.1 pseudouridine-5'-phosphate glycosidase [Acidimicrobiia bacterium]